MEISQVYKTTNVKIICSDDAFLQTLDLIEIELSSRAHEDEEEKRKQESTGVAIASLTQGSKPKPLCRDYVTETGCKKGGQCPFQHPPTTGRCLRCGSTKHVVSECKRPRRDSAPSSTSNPGAAKGKGKGPPLPKAKAGAKKGAKGGQKGGTSTGGGSGGKSSGTGAQPKAQPGKQPNKRSQQQPKGKAQTKGNCSQSQKPEAWNLTGSTQMSMILPPLLGLFLHHLLLDLRLWKTLPLFALFTLHTIPPFAPTNKLMRMDCCHRFLTQMLPTACSLALGCLLNRQPFPNVYICE